MHLLLPILLVPKNHEACVHGLPAHAMDSEYAHARLFLKSRRQVGVWQAVAACVQPSEQSLEGLEGLGCPSSAEECLREDGGLTAAMLATVDLDASAAWCHEEAMRASKERVSAWLAQTAAEDELEATSCMQRCLQAVAACPLRVCP